MDLDGSIDVFSRVLPTLDDVAIDVPIISQPNIGLQPTPAGAILSRRR